MTDKKWWVLHLSRVAKSDYSPCADADDVERILAEHTRRIVDELYRMRNDTVLDDGRFVIDEAIKRIKDL